MIRPAASITEVAARWTLWDSPPGAAAGALHARVPSFAPGDLERAIADGTLLALYTPRTTTAILPADDAAAWAAAHLPGDERELRTIALHAIADDLEPFAAVDLAVAAVRDALAAGPLSRDDLHARLRASLPPGLLPWCDGCQKHHARRGLLVMCGLHGALAIQGKAGRQPRFIDPHLPPADPAACEKRLAGKFSMAYGDGDLASWAGLHPAHGRRILATAPREKHLAGVFHVAGVRLLPPGDPVLRDPGLGWSATGPGAVVADGEIVGTWKARKKGSTLEVSVDAPVDVQAAADAYAPHRGCTTARIV